MGMFRKCLHGKSCGLGAGAKASAQAQGRKFIFRPCRPAPSVIPHPVGEHSSQTLKGRRFNVQKKRKLGPGSEIPCRTSAFGKGSLLQWHFHVICAESLGIHFRQSRGQQSPFFKGEGPAEDPRAGPKLVPLLHTKAPSFCGPAGMMSA